MLEDPLPTNAFPGLRPFETSEYRLFFGREGQSREIINRLSRNRFLAVVGTSGSGKSSLIRAGLLPMLFEGFTTRVGSAWRVALFRPGNNPIGNMAVALSDDRVLGSSDVDDSIAAMLIEASLRRSTLGLVETVRQAKRPADENLLIVVDQFEEIFRFKQAEKETTAGDEAAAFIKLLLEATRQDSLPIYVVITMRSDFLGDCSQFRDLPETLNDGQYLVPRMTRDQRREAISGPITLCGGKIATRLLNRLLNDVGDNPDQLPILQHALMRTWDFWKLNRSNGEPIDLRHYETIGGMDEALSRHADEAYGELQDDRSRRIAEILFKALTEKGSDNREIRRPTRLSEICAVAGASEEEVIGVIEHFRRPGRSFLMPPSDVQLNSESLLDISHESLIRGWKTLRDWVDKEAESAAIYRRLAQTTTLFQRGDAGLWGDPDLMLALEWREKNHPNKVWAQRYYANFDDSMRFLDQSQRAKEAQIEEKEARRERESRRSRNFVSVLAIALVAALGLAVYAFKQKAIAEGATKLAGLNEAKAKKASKKFAAEYTRARKQSSQLMLTISSLGDELIKVSSPTSPTVARYHRQKAIALSLMGENLGAIEELNRALEIFPENPKLRSERGALSVYFESMTNQTVEDLEAASKIDKGYSIYANLALSYAQLGRYEEAEQSIDTAINSFRYNGEYFFDSEVWPAIKAVTGKTLLFSEEDDYRIAFLYEKANIRALAGGEGFIAALQEANQAADKQATDKQGANGEAADSQEIPEDVYLTALNWSWLRKRPQDYGGLISEGALWERFNRPDLARCSYRDFLSKHEKKAEPRYDNLARWAEGRLTEIGDSGTSDCQRLFAGEEVPSGVRTLAVDADVANALGNWKEADDLLTKALEREPKNISLLVQRASVRYDLRQYAESLKDCNKILELAPQTPIAYFYRALNNYALLHEKDENLAASDLELVSSDLEEALNYDRTYTDALTWLGSISEENHKPEEALASYKRALELSPDMVELHPIIAKLQNQTQRLRAGSKIK